MSEQTQLQPTTPTQQVLAAHKWGSSTIARMFTGELSRRASPPRSITRQMVWYWRVGAHRPNPLVLEYLRDYAQDGDVRALAADLLKAQAEPITV